jgi:hypothetical protein
MKIEGTLTWIVARLTDIRRHLRNADSSGSMTGTP